MGLELGLSTREIFKNIADAIRRKLGTSEKITPENMPDKIDSIITSDEVVTPIFIENNGEYIPPSGVAGYSPITVDVPNTYVPEDYGKVIGDNELVEQTDKSISQNGVYDTTFNNRTTVTVPNSYSSSDEGKVVSGSQLVSQMSRTITANGSYDTILYGSILVDVEGGGEHLTFIDTDEGDIVIEREGEIETLFSDVDDGNIVISEG